MVLTNWGYTLTTENTLPDILSVEEFNTMTANKYSTDSRVATTLKATSTAVRNYVGWHLTGNYACEAEFTMDDLHIVRNGNDIDIRLPVGYITGVTHIYFGATKTEGVWGGTEYLLSFKKNGIVRAYNVPQCYERFEKVVVIFTAGLSNELSMGIKAVVAQRTAHTLSAPVGITSETAGGVSISYSGSFVNNAKATALMTDDKEALLPFKVTELL